MKTRFDLGGYQSPSGFSFSVSYALPGVERRELSLTLSYPLSPHRQVRPSTLYFCAAAIYDASNLQAEADNHEEPYAYYEYRVRQPLRQHAHH